MLSYIVYIVYIVYTVYTINTRRFDHDVRIASSSSDDTHADTSKFIQYI